MSITLKYDEGSVYDGGENVDDGDKHVDDGGEHACC
jgi:hypothetical protein